MAILVIILLPFTACEKMDPPSSASKKAETGNVTLTFEPTTRDFTRAMDAYFSKLNIQVFDAVGNKVLSQMKTQTKDDDDFGHVTLNLNAGTYRVVAVGHSSKNSATIKSPDAVQFTASNGEKLTDTFCCCQQIVVDDDQEAFTLDMYRVGAMVQFCFTDDESELPVNFAHVRIDYTGGSANFSPMTLQGITRSTQSELRTTNGIHIYQVFTFPYMSDTGTLKMTVTALDVDGTTIRTRQFDDVVVTRNRITTFSGKFFTEGDGQFSQSDFSFVVHADWDGETHIDF